MRYQLFFVVTLALCQICVAIQRPKFALVPNHPNKQAVPGEVLEYAYDDGSTKVQYKVVQSPTYLLDTDENVVAMTCSANTMIVVTKPDHVWNLTKGTVMVGSKEWNCKDEDGRLGVPFYRSIVSMPGPVKSGSNLVYTITTAPASFADCFMDNSTVLLESSNLPTGLNYSTGIHAAETVSRSFGFNYNAATGKAASAIPFWSKGADSFACTNCFINLDISLSLGLTIGRKDLVLPFLKEFHSSIGGVYSHATEVTLDVKASSASGSGSKIVDTIGLPGFRFFIGFIPAWVDISVPVTAGYSLESKAAVSAVSGYEVTVSHALGLNYSGTWKPWASESFSEQSTKPTLEVHGKASASAYIGAALQMEFYGAVGAAFNLKPTYSAVLEYSGGCTNTQAHVDVGYGVAGTVDAVMTKPIHKASPSFTLFSHVHNFINGCFA